MSVIFSALLVGAKPSSCLSVTVMKSFFWSLIPSHFFNQIPSWVVIKQAVDIQGAVHAWKRFVVLIYTDDPMEMYSLGVFTPGKSDSSLALVRTKSQKLYIVAILAVSVPFHTALFALVRTSWNEPKCSHVTTSASLVGYSLNAVPKLLFDWSERACIFQRCFRK